ncbi:MAG TPA: hypothetical protein VJQ47_14690 [Steroidobacteraceae bacterium]|nr:hypothetical protein [Steroidobacteraceae bacterium]
MNLEVIKGFHGGIVFHCYKNRNCLFVSSESQRDASPSGTAERAVEMFNPNPHPGEWRSSSSRGQKIATLLKHGLSAFIARYQYQAKYFNGQSDGKFEVVPRETERFEAITSAGNN